MRTNLYLGEVKPYVVKKSNYHTINYEYINLNTRSDIELYQLVDIVDLDSLNKVINERGKDLFPRRKNGIKLSKLIENDEIGGSIYVANDETKILHLDSDSDYYRLTLCVFINLNTGETLVDNM
jgi:hypothetical protein